MKLLFPLRHGLASPVLFLLAIGGAIAFADHWMRRQPRPTQAVRPKPAPAPSARRAPVRHRRRRAAAGAA